MSKAVRIKPLLAFFLVAVTGLLGCANTKQSSNPPELPMRSEPQIAADFDKQGIISQTDYWRLHSIYTSEKKQPLSDQDLDYLLNLLQKPSTDAPIKNAKVMAVFIDLKSPLTQQQNQHIVAAVTPLLSSKSELDRKYAGSVLRKLKKLGVA